MMPLEIPTLAMYFISAVTTSAKSESVALEAMMLGTSKRNDSGSVATEPSPRSA